MSILNMVYGSGGGGGGGGEPMTMTIVWDEVSNPSNFFVRYEDDAAGLTQGGTDFDTFFGYSAVLLDNDGNEVEEVTQSSPGVLDMSSFQGALTGTANNVMIKFPRRGIKMSKNGTQVTLSITKEVNKPGYQYYAFTKGNTSRAFLYLGAYKASLSNDNSTVASSFISGTTYMKSWATGVKTDNYSPCTYMTAINMRQTVSIYGNGYSMITIYPRWYINCLYMMKYGNPNSQSKVGTGYAGGSASVAPGGTNNQTNATYGTSSKTQQVKLFGLEDWRGNVSDFIDGCYYNQNTELTVDKTNNVFQNGAYATNLGVQTAGFLKSIDGSNDGMFRNVSASAGTNSTYYTDDTRASSYNLIAGGGSYDYGNNIGAFYIYRSTSGRSNEIGARLMFL